MLPGREERVRAISGSTRVASAVRMSLPVRIMAVKAGQPRWTMEEAE
jgi:hypothetical protein